MLKSRFSRPGRFDNFEELSNLLPSSVSVEIGAGPPKRRRRLAPHVVVKTEVEGDDDGEDADFIGDDERFEGYDEGEDWPGDDNWEVRKQRRRKIRDADMRSFQQNLFGLVLLLQLEGLTIRGKDCVPKFSSSDSFFSQDEMIPEDRPRRKRKPRARKQRHPVVGYHVDANGVKRPLTPPPEKGKE